MKKKSGLRQKVVKRKRGRFSSTLWKIVSLMSSSIFKFCCLIIGLIGISLLFLTIYQYLLKTPYIKLEHVVVTGVDEELKGELLDIAELRFDLSLLAINLNELKEKLEKHPWIRSVELEKRFPHTLLIHAKKEVPWAVVAMEKLYYMDRQGKIFKEVDSFDDVDYPIITGLSPESETQVKALKLAAVTLSALNSDMGKWYRENLSEINIKETGDIALYFRTIPAVIAMTPGELKIKGDKLRKVVEHLKRSGRMQMVRRINLDYGNGIVVSFKEG